MAEKPYDHAGILGAFLPFFAICAYKGKETDDVLACGPNGF